MGYSVLNNPDDVVPIGSLNTSFRQGHKADLLDEMYGIDSNGGTPLRGSLDRAGRHFACQAGDTFGSTSDSSPGSPNCPVRPAPEGQCQNNFTLLFSDGNWNGDADDISLQARADHDSDTNVNTFNSNQTVNTAFDGGVYQDGRAATLADVAMYYYEHDLHPNLADAVPTSAADLNQAPAGSFLNDDQVMHQHMKTYTIGFGVMGNVELADLPDAGFDPVTGGDTD